MKSQYSRETIHEVYDLITADSSHYIDISGNTFYLHTPKNAEIRNVEFRSFQLVSHKINLNGKFELTARFNSNDEHRTTSKTPRTMYPPVIYSIKSPKDNLSAMPAEIDIDLTLNAESISGSIDNINEQFKAQIVDQGKFSATMNISTTDPKKKKDTITLYLSDFADMSCNIGEYLEEMHEPPGNYTGSFTYNVVDGDMLIYYSPTIYRMAAIRDNIVYHGVVFFAANILIPDFIQNDSAGNMNLDIDNIDYNDPLTFHQRIYLGKVPDIIKKNDVLKLLVNSNNVMLRSSIMQNQSLIVFPHPVELYDNFKSSKYNPGSNNIDVFITDHAGDVISYDKLKNAFQSIFVEIDFTFKYRRIE